MLAAAASLAGLAGLVFGILAGIILKPTHLRFCERCGTSMACLACEEVNHGAPRPAR